MSWRCGRRASESRRADNDPLRTSVFDRSHSNMTKSVLLAEYPGDLAWRRFASAYGSTGNDIKHVAAAVLGAPSALWFETGIPALEGLSPSEVFNANSNGEKIIRAVIMRMP